jgi:predicted nucleic acid-binding protein
MQYLLDTNIISYLLDRNSVFHTRITEKLASLPNESKIYISVMTLYEIEYGIAAAKNDSEHKQYQIARDLLLDFFRILPATKKETQIFGRLKASYQRATGIKKKALPRHNVDFIIASTAIANEAILVSNDHIFFELQKHYTLFKIENWTE